MVGRPLRILCVGTTGGWRWMEMVPVVMGIWMSVPAAFPRAIRVVLLIVNAEVVISVPPDLNSSRDLTRIVLVREFDVEIPVSFLDDFHGLEQPTSGESEPYPL
jgi:hypothetical protein